ncbi:MAG: LPS export ABC transporter periplasmic protein LptC [Bacteroidales bacterium]|nr:LPS export ABC transporter periplasmic protein LptC [Bacteroidales bacterium]
MDKRTNNGTVQGRELKRLRQILNKRSFAALAWAALFFSCREKIEIINTSLNPDVPTQLVHDFITSYTDSAVLELRLKAPLMEYYGKQDVPYAEFNEGIEVYFHEGLDKVIGQITANYALYTESKGLWEVRDNVIAVNDEGEILETELLFWDEKKDQIYTDNYVRITQTDQIIMGNGLESDTKFNNWKIKNVTATLYIDDE